MFPRQCAGCGGPVGSAPLHFCWDCRSRLDLIGHPYCSLCGDPAEGMIEHEYVCSLCQRQPVFFDRARSVARYRGPLRRAMQAFKYGGAMYLRQDFGEMLRACVGAHYADVRFDGVVSVPLYPRRERERMYNQSGLLARSLAHKLGLAHLPRFLQRVRATVTQTNLDADERRVNVRRAFRCMDNGWFDGRVLLLVDDVMTTGATVNECARVLKQAGAAAVHVVTVARG
ncbi:MAG: ComF family protein [Kiritimatiellae bacterium]|nr:ComF family protein [Kiritimatiellia bacterium]